MTYLDCIVEASRVRLLGAMISQIALVSPFRCEMPAWLEVVAVEVTGEMNRWDSVGG